MWTSNSFPYFDELYHDLPCLGGSCTVTTGPGVSVTAGATTSGIDFGLAGIGAGDFTGDRKADILWRHLTNGEVWVWLMNGTTTLSQTWAATVPEVGHRIVNTWLLAMVGALRVEADLDDRAGCRQTNRSVSRFPKEILKHRDRLSR